MQSRSTDHSVSRPVPLCDGKGVPTEDTRESVSFRAFPPSVPVRRSLMGQVPYAVLAMRPQQWTKNGLVLLAIIFAGQLASLPAVLRVLVAFAAFSLAASTIYLVNDIVDREKDRLHPRKCRRPLASGRLSVGVAVYAALCCALGAGLLASWLIVQRPPGLLDIYARWGGSGFLAASSIGGYVVLNLLYSFWLKHVVLWDVFVIAFGFVLRAAVGAFAIAVPISPWFCVCTTFFALFLAFGKRRAELVNLREDASRHRANLRRYTLPLLDHLIVVTVTGALVTYCLYTLGGLGSSHRLILTVPVVAFGIARYLYLIYVKHQGERPDELLYRDWLVLASVGVYLPLVLLLIYGAPLVRG